MFPVGELKIVVLCLKVEREGVICISIYTVFIHKFHNLGTAILKGTAPHSHQACFIERWTLKQGNAFDVAWSVQGR